METKKHLYTLALCFEFRGLRKIHRCEQEVISEVDPKAFDQKILEKLIFEVRDKLQGTSLVERGGVLATLDIVAAKLTKDYGFVRRQLVMNNKSGKELATLQLYVPRNPSAYDLETLFSSKVAKQACLYQPEEILTVKKQLNAELLQLLKNPTDAQSVQLFEAFKYMRVN